MAVHGTQPRLGRWGGVLQMIMESMISVLWYGQLAPNIRDEARKLFQGYERIFCWKNKGFLIYWQCSKTILYLHFYIYIYNFYNFFSA